MKRTFISLFLIVILIMTMAACKNNSANINNLQTGDYVKHNIITNSSTYMTSKNNKPAIKNQSDQKETYYGEWSIKKQIAYGPVSTYSNDAIKKMLGKKLTYSDEKAMYETKICEKPAYKKSIISQKDFESSNKVKFSNLGITDNAIVQVVVYTDSRHKDTWNSTGCTFYIKDQNTLILFDGGAYFELDRESYIG
ncbi:hypothetical protein ACJDU8_25140 [Clostridium sp. WILCCON 0269]|uniref:Lipoprotein n=1 Tax=Candidatus Clostridium eludens TaxID=3381663 RepID=A0ABW8SSB6_9CLOT